MAANLIIASWQLGSLFKAKSWTAHLRAEVNHEVSDNWPKETIYNSGACPKLALSLAGWLVGLSSVHGNRIITIVIIIIGLTLIFGSLSPIPYGSLCKISK